MYENGIAPHMAAKPVAVIGVTMDAFDRFVIGHMPMFLQIVVLDALHQPIHRTDVRTFPRIGRNRRCPCGSGVKYKRCCLSSGRFQTYTRI